MRIIGCGNLQRGDDAAGVMVAQKLQALGIDAKVCSGETSELIEAWSNSQDVLVVDAVISGTPVGTIHRWDNPNSFAFYKSASSTHGLGLAEAIGLARSIQRLPAKMLIYGIEGRNFEIGTPISVEVSSAVEEVVKRIVVELKSAG